MRCSSDCSHRLRRVTILIAMVMGLATSTSAFCSSLLRIEPSGLGPIRSQPIQSPFGWHLIQVIERREQDIADEYQRMQARQVLFERRAQPAMEDWLSQLRDRAFIDNRLERQDAINANNS